MFFPIFPKQEKLKSLLMLRITFLLAIISAFFIYYFYPERKLRDGQKADKVVINKRSHNLILYSKNEIIATYSVSLSKNGLEKKQS